MLAVPLALYASAPRLPRLLRWREGLAVASVYLGAHLLMDLFVGGIVPFWPVSEATWVVDLTVDVDTSENRPLVYFDWGTHPGAPSVSRVYAFLTRTDVALAACVLAVAAGSFLARLRSPGTRGPGGRTEP